MRNIVAFVLLMIGASAFAAAGVGPVPEIDPASAGSGLALVSGGLLLLGSRRKK